MSDEGLRAASRRCARRASRTPRSAPSSTTTASSRRARPGSCPRTRSSRSTTCRHSTICRTTRTPSARRCSKAIVLRLNGGLGTSMGLTGAKSLLEAKDGLSFLDIIARQVLALRAEHDAELPLRADGLVLHARGLAGRAGATTRTSTSACRSTSSRTRSRSSSSTDLTPVEWPDDPALEWCPPGHGDLYTALVTSGMLEDAARARLRVRVRRQLRQPRRGARPAHPRLAARASEIPFLMEVTERTEADRKGGHLATPQADGRLVLRETAQTPERGPRGAAGPRAATATPTRTTCGSTCARWTRAMRERDDVLGLPMIRNAEDRRPGRQVLARRLPARDRDGRGDRGLRGRPRADRPAHALRAGQDHRRPARAALGRLPADRRRARGARAARASPIVTLDPDHYKLMRDFDARFPTGPPSLVEGDRFEVEGDVHASARTSSRAGDVKVARARRRSRTAPSSRADELQRRRRSRRGDAARGRARIDRHAVGLTDRRERSPHAAPRRARSRRAGCGR